MYRDFYYSLPVITQKITAETREATLAEIKRAGVDRIFLAIGSITDDSLQMYIESLSENVPFFRAEGYDVGVWICSCGHGGPLAGDDEEPERAEKYTLLTDMEGVKLRGNYCPADPAFISDMARYTAEIAKTHPDIIMLDDDFRLDVRGMDV